MEKIKSLSVFAVAMVIGFASLAFGADLTVGAEAPDFTLTDIQSQPHSLHDYKGKWVVLEWTNYECPFVKKHYDSDNMQKLQKTYTGQGVIWLLINSSAPGNQGNFAPELWQQMVTEKGASPTAVLLDGDGTVGHLYGAKTTPHLFIVNPEGKLVYQGAIDDIPSTDVADIPKAFNYVQAALEESLAGKPVTTSGTKSYGCSVKY